MTEEPFRKGYELVQKTGEEFKAVGTGSKRVDLVTLVCSRLLLEHLPHFLVDPDSP